MGRDFAFPKAFHWDQTAFPIPRIYYWICAVAEIKNNWNEFDVGWFPINILQS